MYPVLEYNISGTHTLLILVFFQGLVIVLILVLNTECVRTFNQYHMITPYIVFLAILSILFKSEFQCRGLFLLFLLRRAYTCIANFALYDINVIEAFFNFTECHTRTQVPVHILGLILEYVGQM